MISRMNLIYLMGRYDPVGDMHERLHDHTAYAQTDLGHVCTWRRAACQTNQAESCLRKRRRMRLGVVHIFLKKVTLRLKIISVRHQKSFGSPIPLTINEFQ